MHWTHVRQRRIQFPSMLGHINTEPFTSFVIPECHFVTSEKIWFLATGEPRNLQRNSSTTAVRFGGIPEGSLNGENLRGLELNWIFKNDVKGYLDISEGTHGTNRKKYV